MNRVLSMLCCYFLLGPCVGQGNIKANLYPGNKSGILFDGSNNPMVHFKAEIIRLGPGKTIKSNTRSHEHFIISKSGSPWISTKTLNDTLSPRSIAVLTKNTKYSIRNKSASEQWFYQISYLAKDPSKGNDSATSFIRKWENVPFKGHERGGVQSYFDIKSSQTKRLELHLTTLNAGLKSHEPHTHKSEEIILMIQGDTKMLIGDQYYEGKGGDLYYVESMLLHGIQNTGSTTCSYFAFQWE
ncbi:MAG: cupin domain-containing protein [Saprospiraceae bacterium]